MVILVGPNSVSNLNLHMGDGSTENQSYFPSKEIVGSLQFAQLFDISYAVAHAAKFIKNPQM
jgi:hypothetical protein